MDQIIVSHLYQSMLCFIEIKKLNDGRGIVVLCMVFPNGHVFVKEIFGKQNSEKYKDMLSSFPMPGIESKYG